MKLNVNNNRIHINNNMLLLSKEWTPKDAYVWWDASDASSIILSLSGSNKVSELHDKGSLGVNISQSTASKQPTFNSTQQNGYSTISFNNANEESLEVSLPAQGITDMIFAIAFKPTTVSNAGQSVFSYNGNAQDFQIEASSNTIFKGYFKSDGYDDHLFDPDDSLNVPQVLSLVGDMSTGELKGYKNGVEKWIDLNYVGWDHDNVTIRIATNRANSRFLGMDFYEAIVTHKNDYEKVHKYLKNKWNI